MDGIETIQLSGFGVTISGFEINLYSWNTFIPVIRWALSMVVINNRYSGNPLLYTDTTDWM